MKKKILTFVFAILLLGNLATTISLIILMPPNEEKLYKSSIEKVVEIRVFNKAEQYGYATGAVIDANGLILTNKHVIQSQGQNFENIQVRFFNREDFIKAKIIKISDKTDLALLKIEETTPAFFKMAPTINPGEMVFTIGNPNGMGLSFSCGYISSAYKQIIHNNIMYNTIQTDIVINEGNSGAALFNNKGQIVGLISFRLKDKYNEVIQGVSFAIHKDEINNFLKDI